MCRSLLSTWELSESVMDGMIGVTLNLCTNRCYTWQALLAYAFWREVLRTAAEVCRGMSNCRSVTKCAKVCQRMPKCAEAFRRVASVVERCEVRRRGEVPPAIYLLLIIHNL